MNTITTSGETPTLAMKMPSIPADCRAFVLFGATGDLARRMLWPSSYALDCDGLLPEKFQLIGAATSQLTREQFAARVKDAILQSANATLFDDAAFGAFISRVSYVTVDVQAPHGLEPIRATLSSTKADEKRGIIFYLSTGPQLFGQIYLALRDSGMVDQFSRVVVEKPIGADTASANRTNEAIAAAFNEDQVFRVDHYLGKEAVQNLLALGFANSLFEPLWNANAIEQVQISVAETVGVDGRWPFYDATGALRDMVQSHLLQLLCLVAMEPPASFTPSAVRNEKVKVLWSLRPIVGADVAAQTVAGQYTAGFWGGQAAKGYLEEAAASTKRLPTRLARLKRLLHCAWRSTTGAGPGYRFICAPASACPCAKARSRSNSSPRRTIFLPASVRHSRRTCC